MHVHLNYGRVCVVSLLLHLFLISSCSTSEDNDEIQRIYDNDTSFVNEPRLLEFRFLAKDNIVSLINDVDGEIIGDSVIDCWCRHRLDSKKMVACISWAGGGKLLLDGEEYDKNKEYDFTRPVLLKIENGGKEKVYKIYMHSFTGLPVVYINTINFQPIESKDNYLRAYFRIVEDVRTRAAGDIFEDSVNIKGRGNFTWGQPKKPYRLKFDHKVPLLGMPSDKSWVLLANYTDRTFLRNYIAFYMGRMSNLAYTPRCHFVEIMLNNRYNGTYLLIEKLKIAKNRVDVGDDGFLLEVDGYAKSEKDSRYFETEHLSQVVNIKDPDVEYGDENFNYAKEYVLNTEKALFSESFMDPDIGYQKYIDVDTFVDWYLINEILRNNDASKWSAFFTLKRGGKLQMGPLWDFDDSVNWNYIQPTDDFYVKQHSWFSRLFEDPFFVNCVKKRYDFFYNKKEIIMNEINEMSEYLKYSYAEDSNRWRVDLNNRAIVGMIDSEIYLVKSYINRRFEWLKDKINEL